MESNTEVNVDNTSEQKLEEVSEITWEQVIAEEAKRQTIINERCYKEMLSHEGNGNHELIKEGKPIKVIDSGNFRWLGIFVPLENMNNPSEPHFIMSIGAALKIKEIQNLDKRECLAAYCMLLSYIRNKNIPNIAIDIEQAKKRFLFEKSPFEDYLAEFQKIGLILLSEPNAKFNNYSTVILPFETKYNLVENEVLERYLQASAKEVLDCEIAYEKIIELENKYVRQLIKEGEFINENLSSCLKKYNFNAPPENRVISEKPLVASYGFNKALKINTPSCIKSEDHTRYCAQIYKELLEYYNNKSIPIVAFSIKEFIRRLSVKGVPSFITTKYLELFEKNKLILLYYDINKEICRVFLVYEGLENLFKTLKK